MEIEGRLADDRVEDIAMLFFGNLSRLKLSPGTSPENCKWELDGKQGVIDLWDSVITVQHNGESAIIHYLDPEGWPGKMFFGAVWDKCWKKPYEVA